MNCLTMSSKSDHRKPQKCQKVLKITKRIQIIIFRGQFFLIQAFHAFRQSRVRRLVVPQLTSWQLISSSLKKLCQGSFWGALGASEVPLGRLLGPLAASWEALRASWKRLLRLLGPLGSILAASWSLLAASWNSWRALGVSGRPLRGFL